MGTLKADGKVPSMAREGDPSVYDQELLRVEQRSQEHTCWTLSGSILVCVAISALVLTGYHRAVIMLVGGGLGVFFAVSGAYIRSGTYHPSFKYVNVLMQISMVTWIIQIDAELASPAYALASMPPLFYGLVTALSGLTVSPPLCLVAGFMSGAQFLLLYFFYLRPAIPAATLAENHELGPAVTVMKATVLAGIGIAAAILARRVRSLLVDVAARAHAEARLELVDRELAVAAQVQARLVPETLPDVP